MNKKIVTLFTFFAVIIFYHIFGFTGHYGYDDLHYAELANSLLNGNLNLEDHYSYRFPVIFFTAISYQIFGINDFASVFPTMIVSMLVILIVFLILKDKGLSTIILGLSFTTFVPVFLSYSDRLMPDFYVVLAVMLVLFFIDRYKYKSQKTRPIKYSFLIALSLFFGFVSKGTIVLILPLLVYFFIIDLFKRRDIKFWMFTILFEVAFLILYFVGIGIITGDFMKRFHAISQNSYLNLCSYDQQPIQFLIRRISYEFFDLMLYQYMLAGLIFAIAGLFKKGARYNFHLNDSFSFYLVSTLILFLSSNFMTISLSSYNPMCLDPRHYLFIIPIAAIPASEIVKKFFKTKEYAIPIVVIVLITAILSYIFHRVTAWYLYVPLSFIFVLFLFLPAIKIVRTIFYSLLVFTLLLKPIVNVKNAINYQYRQQRQVLLDFINNSNEDYLVITNEIQKRLGIYYSAFGKKGNTEFISYTEFLPNMYKGRKCFLFKNFHTQFASGIKESDLPYFARNISSENNVIYKNENLAISVYRLNRIDIPEITGAKLFSSTNSFETIPKYWVGDISTTSEVIFAGEKSQKVKKYSTTFELPLDSVNAKSFENIVVEAKVMCNLYEKNSSLLVLSVVNTDNENNIWSGVHIEKYISAYANWNQVRVESTINCNEFKEGAFLKVYFLNNEMKKVYIDDFSIKIFGLN